MQSGSFFQPDTDAVESGFEFFDRIAAFVERVLAGDARPPLIFQTTSGTTGTPIVVHRFPSNYRR